MKKMTLTFSLVAGFFLLTSFTSAHQPRLVSQNFTKVRNPEISQAFYGELDGSCGVYEIISDQPFDLYVGILSPDIEGTRKDFSAEIYKQVDFMEEGQVVQEKNEIAALDGENFQWTAFYEPFAGDDYFQGPEYPENGMGEIPNGTEVEAGTYIIEVFNPDNRGKYVLVVGTKEEFPPGEIFNTLKTLPELKMEFFGKSPLVIFWNMIGLYFLFFMSALIFFVWILKSLFGRIKRNNHAKTE